MPTHLRYKAKIKKREPIVLYVVVEESSNLPFNATTVTSDRFNSIAQYNRKIRGKHISEVEPLPPGYRVAKLVEEL